MLLLRLLWLFLEIKLLDKSTKLFYEKIKNRLRLHMDELHSIKDNLMYVDEDYDRNIQITRCIEAIDVRQQNIVTVIEALYTMVNYYEKCEEDNVLECYDERIMYVMKETKVVELDEIHCILKSFDMCESWDA
jgi:hypothetical protein